jgi:hypothetical protein
MIDVVAERNGELDAGARGSLLARLRERAADAQREHTIDVNVGGPYGDMLVARYSPPTLDELERLAEYVGQSSELSITLETMMRASVAMLTRDDDGTLDEITDDGVVVTLGARLLRVLELPVPADELSAREVFTTLYGGNGPAIALHVAAFSERVGTAQLGPTSPTSDLTSSLGPRSSASPRSTS